MLYSKVKTKTGTEDIIAYTWEEIELKEVEFQKQKQHKKFIEYSTEFACLDTETSHDNLERGWIYQWAVYWNGAFIYGRTPDETIRLLYKMSEFYELRDDKRIIVYIHNASYDLQYLKHFLLIYDDQMKVLATDAHTYLICDVFGFRILCSYKLSNLSLATFSKDYAQKYIKAVGEIDYTVVRYQDEELTDNDWFYMFSDVASQHDAIAQFLKINGFDYAYKAPFTSTGFVRSYCRNKSRKFPVWWKQFTKSQLTLEMYNLCNRAFMGGSTICNYQIVGQTIRGNLGHIDFTSSYPTRQMLDYFPRGKPSWYGDIESTEELSYLLNEYCCIFVATYTNISIKDGITAPYIPSSKGIVKEGTLKLNGKLVKADTFSMAMCEIDFSIINSQYSYDNVVITNMLTFERGKTPKWLRDSVMVFFDGKCKLKHSDPVLYMAMKALLNGIYGMSATALVREQFDFTDGIITKGTTDGEKQINRYYSSRNNFMPYQYGIYTTAHARKALFDLIAAVGYENFLYCDTDSIFYIKSEETEKAVAEYNEKIKERAIEAGAYIDDNILGVATAEPEIRAFRGLHAKCYAIEEKNKKGEYELKVIIAGIPKQSIKWINGKPVKKTNAEELGNIDNLEDGFVFRHCGGTRTIYNESERKVVNINGHETVLASSAIIENIAKEISDTMFTRGADYSALHIQQSAF